MSRIVPPEAVLIRNRRQNALPRLSHRTAAYQAEEQFNVHFSPATWQKIEAGLYRGGADRIAMMASVVGLIPEELEVAGRQDAALLLQQATERRDQESELKPRIVDDVTRLLLEIMNTIREAPGLSADQRAELQQQVISSQLSHLRSQLEHIHLLLRLMPS